MNTNNLNLQHVKNKNQLFEIYINDTIKKTYMLLALSLFVSVLSAYLGIIFNYKINFIVFILFSYSSLYVMEKHKNNYIGLVSLFLFTAFLGFSLGPLLNSIMFQHINGASIIGLSLSATGITFFALSGYALLSKKNFNFLSGFLSISICVIIFLIIFRLFFYTPIIQLVLSGLIALFSATMILRTTSNMIYERGERNCISITASLFLDIYNLFISFLYIFSFLSDRK